MTTDGRGWRVERLRRFLWWRWWSVVTFQDITEPLATHTTFASRVSACNAMRAMRERDEAKAHGWRAIE
jgi:hypothetical protein